MRRRRVVVVGSAAVLLAVSSALAPWLLPAEVLVLVAFGLERLRSRFAPPPLYDLPVCAYRVLLWFRSLGRRHALP